ncbi:MAG: type II toxin-antitoxin system VapC family toxin [Propionibacterium sp.]|nr:type II toxin-antitoxin system VapC family toxin [Propionibacterium sp.]
MVIETVAVSTLFAPMWSMRHNISGYDAAYVALALMLECPLVTCDRRLTHAAPRGVQVHIVGGDQSARAG